MGDKRLLKAAGDYTRSFASEDGKHYRVEHQDMNYLMKRAKLIKEGQEYHNVKDRKYVGSVPISMVTDWCNRNGFTFDQFARNDGGIRGKAYPESKSGVKDKFMAYFLTPEFSKLHGDLNAKRKTSSGGILVPDNYKAKTDGNIKPSGAKAVDS